LTTDALFITPTNTDLDTDHRKPPGVLVARSDNQDRKSHTPPDILLRKKALKKNNPATRKERSPKQD
jgi:hypothetical protein